MDVKLHPMFAVPFATCVNPLATAMNRDLRQLILRLEQEGEAHRNPTPLMSIPAGLYESDFTFFARGEPCVRQLREFCWAALGELIGALSTRNREQLEGLRISSHTWFHVTRDGGWFGYHNHPMASWSGVYCVDDGAPDPAFADNGVLTFPHPMPASNTFLDAANLALRWPYSHANYAQRLAPGQLVLFPSWLGHFVSPYRGSGERITVAFNCWFADGSEQA